MALMILTDWVMEPADTKTVSKNSVSAENSTMALAEVIKEFFRQADKSRTTDNNSRSGYLFIGPKVQIVGHSRA